MPKNNEKLIIYTAADPGWTKGGAAKLLGGLGKYSPAREGVQGLPPEKIENVHNK